MKALAAFAGEGASVAPDMWRYRPLGELTAGAGASFRLAVSSPMMLPIPGAGGNSTVPTTSFSAAAAGAVLENIELVP
jgi:hypothetical protein